MCRKGIKTLSTNVSLFRSDDNIPLEDDDDNVVSEAAELKRDRERFVRAPLKNCRQLLKENNTRRVGIAR